MEDDQDGREEDPGEEQHTERPVSSRSYAVSAAASLLVVAYTSSSLTGQHGAEVNCIF